MVNELVGLRSHSRGSKRSLDIVLFPESTKFTLTSSTSTTLFYKAIKVNRGLNKPLSIS